MKTNIPSELMQIIKRFPGETKIVYFFQSMLSSVSQGLQEGRCIDTSCMDTRIRFSALLEFSKGKQWF